MEKKTKAEKPISPNTGCQLFNGVLTLKLWGGKEVKVRCDYCGIDLQRASQEHQIVMLIKQHLTFNELDFGWLVRTKDMDKDRCFGLKSKKSNRHWPVYNYGDVIAWGYVDGGCNNPKHENSCHMRPEDYPQWACDTQEELDEEWEDEDDNFPSIERKGVVLRFDSKEKGAIHYNAVIGTDEEMERGGTKLMHACAKVFDDFRKEHPEVTEMHFYTDDELEVSE